MDDMIRDHNDVAFLQGIGVCVDIVIAGPLFEIVKLDLRVVLKIRL